MRCLSSLRGAGPPRLPIALHAEGWSRSPASSSPLSTRLRVTFVEIRMPERLPGAWSPHRRGRLEDAHAGAVMVASP